MHLCTRISCREIIFLSNRRTITTCILTYNLMYLKENSCLCFSEMLALTTSSIENTRSLSTLNQLPTVYIFRHAELSRVLHSNNNKDSKSFSITGCFATQDTAFITVKFHQNLLPSVDISFSGMKCLNIMTAVMEVVAIHK